MQVTEDKLAPSLSTQVPTRSILSVVRRCSNKSPWTKAQKLDSRATSALHRMCDPHTQPKPFDLHPSPVSKWRGGQYLSWVPSHKIAWREKCNDVGNSILLTVEEHSEMTRGVKSSKQSVLLYCWQHGLRIRPVFNTFQPNIHLS